MKFEFSLNKWHQFQKLTTNPIIKISQIPCAALLVLPRGIVCAVIKKSKQYPGRRNGLKFSFFLNKDIIFKKSQKIPKSLFQKFHASVSRSYLGASLCAIFKESKQYPGWRSNLNFLFSLNKDIIFKNSPKIPKSKFQKSHASF